MAYLETDSTSGHWQRHTGRFIVLAATTLLEPMFLGLLDKITFVMWKVVTLTLMMIDYGMEVAVYLMLHDAVIRVTGSVRISLKLLVMTLSFDSVQMRDETMKMFILNVLNFTFNETELLLSIELKYMYMYIHCCKLYSAD